MMSRNIQRLTGKHSLKFDRKVKEKTQYIDKK